MGTSSLKGMINQETETLILSPNFMGKRQRAILNLRSVCDKSSPSEAEGSEMNVSVFLTIWDEPTLHNTSSDIPGYLEFPVSHNQNEFRSTFNGGTLSSLTIILFPLLAVNMANDSGWSRHSVKMLGKSDENGPEFQAWWKCRT